ncbi:MAG: chromosomal replication initiator protein DnaA [Desulfobacula sp.]|nr:chromosomal replication initiator protein DnaA [Desulfobacula sp.]
MESTWKQVKHQLKKALPDHSYRMWIDPVKLIEYDNQDIKLSSPNSYFIKRLKDNYLPLFELEFSKLGINDVNIEFKVSSNKTAHHKINNKAGAYPAIPLIAKSSKQMNLPGLGMKFDNGRIFKKGFTFDDFVVGDNSNFAYSASLSLAHGKIKGYSILYLLAKTGLGKSHLSQAVGHHIIKNSLSSAVYYITAEDFTNEMIFSLKNNTIDQFKKKYRTKCDVLILEDIHFLSGKNATQKELAITLDYLLEADKKIIFSGCELPEDIPKLNEQLKSRLTLGLVTQIDAPDYSTRLRILKRKSKKFGYNIPAQVTEYIAQELCDDVRQLESGLFGVAAKGQLMGCNIDVELAKSVLLNIAKTKKQVTIESIKKLVCKEFSISYADIVSASRKQRIVKPRQMAIFLARKYTDQPIKTIGTSFNKYHATAIYAINAIEKELKQKSVLFNQIKYLSKKIETGNL